MNRLQQLAIDLAGAVGVDDPEKPGVLVAHLPTGDAAKDVPTAVVVVALRFHDPADARAFQRYASAELTRLKATPNGRRLPTALVADIDAQLAEMRLQMLDGLAQLQRGTLLDPSVVDEAVEAIDKCPPGCRCTGSHVTPEWDGAAKTIGDRLRGAAQRVREAELFKAQTEGSWTVERPRE